MALLFILVKSYIKGSIKYKYKYSNIDVFYAYLAIFLKQYSSVNL